MAKERVARPLICCPCVIGARRTTYYLAEAEVTVEVPPRLAKSLVEICNGELSYAEVLDSLARDWDRRNLRGLLGELVERGVIVSGGGLSLYVWPFVKNPSRLAREVSDAEILRLVRKADRRHRRATNGERMELQATSFTKLVGRRHSIRSFDGSRAVDSAVVTRMLWAAYGIVSDPLLIESGSPQRVKVWQGHQLLRHTVPSAGALYPLQVSLIVFRPLGDLAPGVYRIGFTEPGAITVRFLRGDLVAAYQAFADPTVISDAHGVVVVSATFPFTEEKYGNRAILYTTLEAGHVAQNVHLAAAESGVGTVEVGGFIEAAMRDALRLPARDWPLTTVLFGYPSRRKVERVSVGVDVRWATPTVGCYRMPFTMAFARLVGDGGDWSCGRSPDPELARAKATSEAIEWSACGIVSDRCVTARIGDLSGAIDPRTIVAYDPRQYGRKGFAPQPFSEEQRHQWTPARDEASGTRVYVLADCVYFPYAPRHPRYTFANSSGAACHPDRDQVVKRATLELIERDAFSITWINSLAMPQLTTRSLPADIQQRITALRRQGFRIVVKDLTFDLAPVVLVFAQSERLSTTTVAAASDFEVETALDRALMEVEASVHGRIGRPGGEPIYPRMVQHTDDHGRLYEQPAYYRRANILGSGGQRRSFSDVGCTVAKDWAGLVSLLERRGLRLYVADLEVPKGVATRRNRIHAVKAFVPGLVPLHFGYGLEPLGMDRLFSLPVHQGLLRKPRRYGEAVRFPHPYN